MFPCPALLLAVTITMTSGSLLFNPVTLKLNTSPILVISSMLCSIGSGNTNTLYDTSPHVIPLNAFHEILKNVTQIVDTFLRRTGDGGSVNILDMYVCT